jgi:hypothetical protein
MEHHPAASIIPRMPDEQFAALKAEQRAEALKAASADGKPTPKKVRAAVQKHKPATSDVSPERKIADARKVARAGFGKMYRAMMTMGVADGVTGELDAVLKAIDGK